MTCSTKEFILCKL